MEMELADKDYSALLALALKEDVGRGDVTSEALIPGDRSARAKIIAREPLVVCGQAVAHSVFSALSSEINYTVVLPDGVQAAAGQVIAEINGPLRSILTGERTALNFLQRLSGIATGTRRVISVAEPGVRVLDTRKTTPGWRALEKYAVRTGGGSNHRFGLYDAVLIKNNHIDAVGGDVARAVEMCRAKAGPGMKIEVEVRNMDELRAALKAKPDAILLDNMLPEALREASSWVRRQGSSVELEASGGISLETVAEYTKTGVDSVSIGSLTHSAPAVDISLRFAGDKV